MHCQFKIKIGKWYRKLIGMFFREEKIRSEIFSVGFMPKVILLNLTLCVPAQNMVRRLTRFPSERIFPGRILHSYLLAFFVAVKVFTKMTHQVHVN